MTRASYNTFYAAIFMLLCNGLSACAPKVQSFHGARMNAMVSSAKLHEGNSQQTLRSLRRTNDDISERVQLLRILVARAEGKADLCEQKADMLSRPGGTYSKIR